MLEAGNKDKDITDLSNNRHFNLKKVYFKISITKRVLIPHTHSLTNASSSPLSHRLPFSHSLVYGLWPWPHFHMPRTEREGREGGREGERRVGFPWEEERERGHPRQHQRVFRKTEEAAGIHNDPHLEERLP